MPRESFGAGLGRQTPGADGGPQSDAAVERGEALGRRWFAVGRLAGAVGADDTDAVAALGLEAVDVHDRRAGGPLGGRGKADARVPQADHQIAGTDRAATDEAAMGEGE